MEKEIVINVFAELGEQLSYVNDEACTITEKYLQGDEIEYKDLQDLFAAIRLLNMMVSMSKKDLLKDCEAKHD